MFSKASPTPYTPASTETLLTAQNCQSPQRIRAFLRLSRFATDDTIREHINDSTSSCDQYFRTKIVPQWTLRASMIKYCHEYALELQQRTHLDEALVDIQQHPSFDLTIDPYARSDYLRTVAIRSETSASVLNWTQNELAVEKIVRELTISVLNEKCQYKDWLRDFEQALKLAPPPRNL